MQDSSNHSYNGSRRRRLIRLGGVKDLTGLSRSYIYELSAQGRFPQSVPLVPGGSSRAWVEDEILDFIDQRIAERDQGVIDEKAA